MCIYTGLANIKNPSTGVQWASVVVLILFQLLNGLGPIWLGEFHLPLCLIFKALIGRLQHSSTL